MTYFVLESEGEKMAQYDRDDVFDDENGLSGDDIIQNGLYQDSAIDTPTLPREVTDEVVRFYSPMVYRIALTKTKSTHDADDIFSEVFLRLVANKKPFDSEEHRKAWLIRVTVNCCNSHFVAPWRKNVDCLDDFMLSQIPDEDSAIDREDNASDVYAQVLRLPDNMREVILLFYYENMSVREIAEALGESEANIKKRLSRARQKLKLELE